MNCRRFTCSILFYYDAPNRECFSVTHNKHYIDSQMLFSSLNSYFVCTRSCGRIAPQPLSFYTVRFACYKNALLNSQIFALLASKY